MPEYKKKIFLISNAHIDPVWQWEWDEGAAASVSTFRVAAKFCREYDGYIFCHNEAALYEWVEEYEPSLFEEIRQLIKEGRWHVIGGFYIQPDCNMPCGESFIRQALYGRRYFLEKFNVEPKVAVNFDSFGHSRGLVQVLAKCGYEYYMHCRPGDIQMPNSYRWVGYDGSSVIGERQPSGYGTGLGGAASKARSISDMTPEGGLGVCLWGVGDHGGGASKIDLDALDAFIKESAEAGILVKHATPEEYFESIDKDSLPIWDRDINPWAVGCYTSQSGMKAMYRALEDMFYSTEKTATAALSLKAYPAEQLKQAEKAMLFAMFHDYLPGSSVEPVEAMGKRQLGGAYDTLTKVRTASFFALCSGQKQADSDEIPVLVYNPHPYPVSGVFESEFMLWDQGWGDTIKVPRLTDEFGNSVPCQQEKELSSIPIDWRKRIAFSASLAPMSVSRFCCRFDDMPKEKLVPHMRRDGDCYVFDNGRVTARLSTLTGLLEQYCVDGESLLSGESFRLDIISDNCDPWGMTVNSYRAYEKSFSLLSPEEGTVYSALKDVIPSVRVIEDGPVRTVCEAVFGCGASRAVITYKFSKNDTYIDVTVRVDMTEKQKMLKLAIAAAQTPVCIGQVVYGSDVLADNGDESVSQRYRILRMDKKALLVSGKSVYGSNMEKNELKLSLIRTASYTAHPLGDRKILPTDRYMPHIDIGQQIFCFRINGGESDYIADRAERLTQAYCEEPYCLSFFPSGEGEKPVVPLTITGDDAIVMTSYKPAEYANGKTVRLFNPTDKARIVSLNTPDNSFEVTVPARAFETYLLDGGIRKIRADELET